MLVPAGHELSRLTRVERDVLSAPPPSNWSPLGHSYPAAFCESAGLLTAADFCCRYPVSGFAQTAYTVKPVAAALALLTRASQPLAVGQEELMLLSRLLPSISAPPLNGTVWTPLTFGQVTLPDVSRPFGAEKSALTIL